MMFDKENLMTKLKSLSMGIVVLFTMLLPTVAWGQTLEKGIYTITNNVSHDNAVGQGMARSYTEAISDVEVNDNGTYVTLGFNNTQYMGDFSISVDGSSVSYETSSAGNNIKKLKFKVPSLSSKVKVGLYVVPMNTTVEYTVTFNEGSLELVKAAETVPETPENNTPTVDETKPQETVTQKPAQTTTVKPAASSTNQNTATTTNTTNTATTQKEEEKKVEAPKSPEATNQATIEAEKTAENQQEQADVAAKSPEEEATTEEADTSPEATDEIVQETEAISVEADTKEEATTEDTVSEATKSTSSSILLIIAALVIVGAVGFGIYWKRK